MFDVGLLIIPLPFPLCPTSVQSKYKGFDAKEIRTTARKWGSSDQPYPLNLVKPLASLLLYLSEGISQPTSEPALFSLRSLIILVNKALYVFFCAWCMYVYSHPSRYLNQILDRHLSHLFKRDEAM